MSLDAYEALPRATTQVEPTPPSTLRGKMQSLVDPIAAKVEEIQRVTVGGSYFNVEGYTGATFDDRFALALADANSAGGTIIVPAGAYTSSTLGTVTSQRVSIEGPGGPQATRITHTGTGNLLTFAPNPQGVDQMGTVRGIRFLGNANAGTRAIRCVDCGVLPDFEDVVISGFNGSGSVGIDIENVAIWNERGSGRRVSLEHNTIGMRLTGGGPSNSLFYHRWLDLRLNIAANQIGIQARGTALLQGGIFNITVNMDGSNGVVMDLADTASWGGDVYLSGEQTTGTGGILRRLAAGAYWAASGAVGVVGCVDSGTVANIWSPFERFGTHVHHLFPAVPSVTMGAAAGTSPPTPTISGNDTRLWVAGGSGTGPAPGPYMTVTYQTPYSQVPFPTLTPYGAIAAACQPYILTFTTTGFVIGVVNAPPASSGAGTISFVCHVTG